MADDYSPEDRAELVAEGLGITPSSYAGRIRDAIPAMALVGGYRRMSRNDQNRVLGIIANDMGFADTNPVFFSQCQGAIALMVANPAWVPGSLDNTELETEITFWRHVKSALDYFGFKPAGQYFQAKQDGVFKTIVKNLKDAAPTAAAGWAAIKTPMKAAITPTTVSGIVIYGVGAATIADSSLSDLEQEAKRRGQLGSMTRLHSERFGPQP